MTPSHSSRGGKRYRYYVCSGAQKRGWSTCPAPSIPAAEIERFVVDEIRAMARQPGVDNPQGEPFGRLRLLECTWDYLGPSEQAHLLRSLLARVTYNWREAKVSITFAAASATDPDAESPVYEENGGCPS